MRETLPVRQSCHATPLPGDIVYWTQAPASSFDLLGIASREISISRLIAGLLATREHRGSLLAALGCDDVAADSRFIVATEFGFDVDGRRRAADVVCAWAAGGRATMLVVENKLYASEGKEQSTDLVKSEAKLQQALVEAFAEQGVAIATWASTCWRFLTLFNEPARDHRFVTVTYDRLIRALQGCAGDAAVAWTARDFGTLLSRFYAIPEQARRGSLEQAMTDCRSAPLDAGFLVFNTFAQDVSACCGIGQHGSYRGVGSGRSWYGAHYSKHLWNGRCMSTADAAHFDEHHWWVAFQLRYVLPTGDTESGAVELAVYFETFPYYTQADFAARVSAESADRYRSLRDGFRRRLKSELRDLPWSIRGHWCQVAKAYDTSVGALHWREAVTAVAQKMNDAVAAVEAALHALPRE